MDYQTPPPSSPPQPPSSEPPLPADEAQEQSKRGGGRARERYERRKQHATPRTLGAAPRQLKVPQEVRLPALRIPHLSRFLVGAVAAVAFVAIVVFALGKLRGTPTASAPNAIWLGPEWSFATHTDAEFTNLAKQLKAAQIGTIYAWVSDLQPDGTWRSQDKMESVKAFVRQFKAAYPEAELDGWLSLPAESAPGKTRLDDVNLQQTVANFSKSVVTDFGFKGVFLLAEPIWDSDQNYLALLRAVRAAVGISTPISAAIPPDWSPSNSNIPLPPLMEPGTEWKKEYKQSVALLVDHMDVMVYNSTLKTPSDYAQWVAYQVKAYAEAIAELNTKTDIMIGVPTFDAAPPGHDPAVENIDSAVQGVKSGMQQAGDAASYVKGLAIYGWWTTKDADWTAFQKDWVSGR